MGYEFVVYVDKAGEWRWLFRAVGNSKTIADSGEGYKDKRDCLYGISLIKRFAPGAPVVDGVLR